MRSFSDPFSGAWHSENMEAIVSDTQSLSESELIRQHQAGLWRYLRFLGCSDHEAEDLVQETFLKVLRQSFEQRSSAETAAYLRTVAKNLFLMAMRKADRSPAFCDLELADTVWAEFARHDGGQGHLDLLRECLDGLPPKSRQAIDLRYLEERSREEMADSLEMTLDGVKSLLRRLRTSLRECVQRKQSSDHRSFS